MGHQESKQCLQEHQRQVIGTSVETVVLPGTSRWSFWDIKSQNSAPRNIKVKSLGHQELKQCLREHQRAVIGTLRVETMTLGTPRWNQWDIKIIWNNLKSWKNRQILIYYHIHKTSIWRSITISIECAPFRFILGRARGLTIRSFVRPLSTIFFGCNITMFQDILESPRYQ